MENNPSLSSKSITLEHLKEFIETLESYAHLLKKENEAITTIDSDQILSIVEQKKSFFLFFEENSKLIDEIFTTMSDHKLCTLSPKLLLVARKKASSLLEFIQIQGRVNHQLLQSLDHHTKSLLGNLSGIDGNETYAHLKKKSQR